METNPTQQNTVIKAIVLDIEGTTCPVNFVSQTLFPFAQRQLAKTICTPNRKPGVSAAVEEAIAEWKRDSDPASQALLLQATLEFCCSFDNKCHQIEIEINEFVQ